MEELASLGKEELIRRFVGGGSRERRALLKVLRPQLEREDVIRIAPAIRDSSPKIAARVTSLLARHELAELFESLLAGLKPGKVQILRHHFAKISPRGSPGGSGRAS